MAASNLFFIVAITVLFVLDVWQNIRIIRAYSAMGKMTSTMMAVTEESREGFRLFFPLCGWGTHGAHILHVVTDTIVLVGILASNTNPDDIQLLGLTAAQASVPTILLLAGFATLHWKQADAASMVVRFFFSRDLPILAGGGDPTLLDQRDDPPKEV